MLSKTKECCWISQSGEGWNVIFICRAILLLGGGDHSRITPIFGVVWQKQMQLNDTKTFCDLHITHTVGLAKRCWHPQRGWPGGFRGPGQAFHPADWQGSLSRMYPHVPTEPTDGLPPAFGKMLFSSSGVLLSPELQDLSPEGSDSGHCSPLPHKFTLDPSYHPTGELLLQVLLLKATYDFPHAKDCLCITP